MFRRGGLLPQLLQNPEKAWSHFILTQLCGWNGLALCSYLMNQEAPPGKGPSPVGSAHPDRAASLEPARADLLHLLSAQDVWASGFTVSLTYISIPTYLCSMTLSKSLKLHESVSVTVNVKLTCAGSVRHKKEARLLPVCIKGQLGSYSTAPQARPVHPTPVL